MQAVIVAGGLGTRLREETTFRPKPSLKIAGRPVLWRMDEAMLILAWTHVQST
jgi:glucose-1-phosphate cytidylyltransferase